MNGLCHELLPILGIHDDSEKVAYFRQVNISSTVLWIGAPVGAQSFPMYQTCLPARTD